MTACPDCGYGKLTPNGNCLQCGYSRLGEATKETVDNVNNPSHYGQGSIEAIDYIQDFLTEEEFQGYLRGNIAKYLHRWPYKNGIEDLKKAQWYLNKLIGVKEDYAKEDDPKPVSVVNYDPWGAGGKH